MDPGSWGVELARQVPALVVLSWVVWQTGKHAKEAAELNLELMNTGDLPDLDDESAKGKQELDAAALDAPHDGSGDGAEDGLPEEVGVGSDDDEEL